MRRIKKHRNDTENNKDIKTIIIPLFHLCKKLERRESRERTNPNQIPREENNY